MSAKVLEAPDHTRISDDQLVVSAIDGDVEAFSLLYDRYYRLAFRMAYGMTGRPDSAEDMTQEIFLRTYKNLRMFRRESTFSTWFFRLASNCCLSYCRRHRRKAGREFTIDVDAALRQVRHDNAPLEPLEARMLEKQIESEVHRALLSLKPKLRLFVVLRDLEGLSYDEIAERTGCARGTIGSRLNRARSLLARKLAHLERAI